MTEENEDKRWVTDNAGNKLCADVARAVYDHFHKPEGGAEAVGRPRLGEALRDYPERESSDRWDSSTP